MSETRQRIQALAREMGYRKDPYVTALMAQVHTGRRREEAPVLAVLNALSGHALRSEPTFNEILRGFDARAKELGYTSDVILCDGGENAIRDVPRHLNGRGIRAAFVPASMGSLELAESLHHTSLVSVTGHELRNRIHTTGPNHFQNASLAAAKLLETGRTRFAILVPEGWRSPPLYDWLGGLRAELQFAFDTGKLKRLTEPRLLRASPQDIRSIQRLLKTGKTQPDAILGYPGTFKNALTEAGFSIPHEISFANPALFPGEVGPGIDPRRFDVGQAAADILTAQLHRHEYGMPRIPRSVLLEGLWVGS
jgi:DNA-binding LacI/PurR family transcriptional regulator